ncbi:FAD-binding protein [Pseudenhygromyxa sp. WMMC2535]|uniref:FAD-binding oxidoreductase n=1 Tax=Pseudenhygromyxa sp. WMMC2535 TaxID=2712867 RepID=UPI0015529C5A|nr:FAD-linked oxidase C-terminal domain-containing protein [Pseudenhygromyxa sp. WMMC2535]NVB40492.1 FAD-binding protein [Pseudenhygromyxa sp. WMMC2535]
MPSSATAPAWRRALEAALPSGRVVADPDILESHRYDHASLVDAGVPAVLVRARSTAEVQAVMRVAHEHRVPVVPRGAGSGLAGGANAIDGCIVLSLAAMNRILAVDPAAMIAVVEPGVINAELGRAVKTHGLFYPPDPASYEMCTIGGNVATNAGGLCCVKYGVTRESVLGLEVVLADGSLLRCGSATIKSVAGYDLTRLFIGAEGTLGVVTQVTLRLRPKPPPAATLAAFFPSMAAAGEAIERIVHDRTPALLEIMDRATLRAVEAWKPMELDTDAAAMLIARSDAADPGAEIERFAAICDAAGASELAHSDDEAEGEMLMAARRLCYPALERMGSTLLDDVAVPISRIPEMFAATEAIAARFGLTIGNFGHAGDGNLHPTIVFDARDPDSLARTRAAFDALVEDALRLGGTVTGEHGVGLLKRGVLAQEIGDAGVHVHKAIKQALDPRGILNPGKLVPD